MSELTGEETLVLSRAVLLYEANRGSGHQTALATVHDVMPDGRGGSAIAAGRLLTRDVLDDLLRGMSGLPQRRQLLPPNVLLSDGGRMAWWVPAERRPIFFRTKDERFNRAVSGKVVPHPAVLFVAEPGHLFIYALGESERPEADTAVYRAPYLNLYDTGSMCRGNAPLPASLSTSDLPAWERAFFETNFTHSNIPWKQLTLHPQGHHGMWRALARKKSPQGVPPEWLVPLKRTVEEVLNR